MKNSHVSFIRTALVPVVVYLPLPWEARAFLLASMVYWFGPIAVYFTQRMPAFPMIERLPDSDPSLPPRLLHRLEEILPALRQAGFVELARLRGSDPKNPARCVLALLQHPETSDIAHVVVGGLEKISSETLVYSRARSDGSRLSTATATLPSPFPPPPQDSVLRLSGTRPPLDLWRIHQARVAADSDAIRNPAITNGLAFQTELEAQAVARHVKSGYWRRAPGQLFLRPTPIGALRMTLRMLPPWKQFDNVRARRMFRRLAVRDAGPPVAVPRNERI